MSGKVLVVDDEDTLRLTIKTRLATGGFETEDAVDGEQALEKLKQTRFDVVLLDINMPRMDGITALGVISELYPTTDVIMLTGFADFSTAIECLKKGAKDYLVKPIDTTELITRMRSLQRARSSEAALEEANRSNAAFLLNQILGRAVRMHDVIEALLKGSYGKVSKEQNAVLGLLKEISDSAAAEIKNKVDPKFLKAGSMALSVKSVAVDKLAKSAVAGAEQFAEAKEVELKHSEEKNLPKIDADDKLLEGALSVTASALVDLSSKGGTVTVHVGKGKNSTVEMQWEATKVGDRGKKIAEQTGKAFDTMGSSLAKLENSVALLLAARGVVEAHGGEFRAEAAKGNLSIRCTLPVKQPQ